MRIFDTYLYEVLKGTKPVALVTCDSALLDRAFCKLKQKDLSYFVQNIGDGKTNLFFGKKECIDVIEKFLNKPLCALSPLEDFTLGIILGYDVCLQCKRLLDRSEIKN